MNNLRPANVQQIRPSKQLLLVGGGHSHVTVIKQLGMRPIPGVKVTLVTPSLKTAYSGMLRVYYRSLSGLRHLYRSCQVVSGCRHRLGA